MSFLKKSSAGADLEPWEETRMPSSRGREALSRKDILSIVVMPLVLVFLTALLGTMVGVWLQNRSFRNNEVFKARLERIMVSQREAAEILVVVHEARRQIRSNEDYIRQEFSKPRGKANPSDVIQFYRDNNPMRPSMAVLRESQLRLDALGDYAESLSPQSSVPSAIQAYTKRVDAYIGCLNDNSDFSARCTDDYPDLLDLLKKVVAAHAEMVDELIQEHQ